MVIHEAPSTLEPIDLHRHSLTEQVYDAIRDAIVSKALPPGIRLSEAALAEKFGVSKTPVREALLRLGAVGLVDGILDRLCQELGKNTKVIATGGQASLVASASKYKPPVDSSLTLDGLRIIYERNLENGRQKTGVRSQK